ncbi:NAD(P)H-dependent oxidoreductase [Vallitalea guaymasensis]|uniref:NAD(P)H-dependent oxidoreductase n=1 Tax=Vallitalea guaymasensis TaxID=1185412 RepID=UPI00272B6D04|nr:NAD(P)H-dependent oxidoreductase [Vallitalea guaymasensis]
MKTVIIREFGDFDIDDAYTFDLTQVAINDCIGCWTCWWKTPGRCVHKDLDEFYSKYLNADKVIIFSKVTKGFVSGNLKTLFDRMIPHYLPYTTYSTGETMHVPRYEKYPDIQVFYQGDFAINEGREIYEDYIRRTFYQFYSKNISVKPIEEYSLKEVLS